MPPPAPGPPVVALVGSAQQVDTSALLDVLEAACAGGDGIVDARDVPAMTSPLFGVLQALARRLGRDGARLVVVCPKGELARLRPMRAGRDFELSGSLERARWELERPPARFRRG
jgi:hypothetical protein